MALSDELSVSRVSIPEPPPSYECISSNPTSTILKRKKTTQPASQPQDVDPWIPQGRSQEVDVSQVAGRLRFFQANWETLTSDKYVLNCISSHKINFIQKPFQSKIPYVRFNSQKDFRRMEIAVNSLIDKGVIEKCLPHPD